MKFQVCLLLMVASVLVMESSAIFRRITIPIRTCPAPPSLANTIRRGCRPPYTHRERCTYRCRRFYIQVSGSTVRTCTNGAWDGTELVCRRERCSVPPSPPFTYRTGCGFPYTNGETCNYMCRSGYTQVSGSNQINCTYGVWSANDMLVCVLGCVSPPVVPGTTRFGCSPYYTTGENCYYKCYNNRDSYCKEVSGDYIRKCLPNGHWSGRNLVCDCVDNVGCCRPDIVFMLDFSGSIQDSEFATIKDFVAALVDRFDVGVLDAQIGVTRYSTSVLHEFHLNTHDNKADVLQAVDAMPINTNGGTYTGAALTYVASTMLLPGNGNRAEAPDTVIVLTDGYASDSVTGPASVLHGMGVQTFAIGVGGCVNSGQLNQIASCSDYIYNLPDFNALESIAESMHDQICCHKKNNACPSGYQWYNGICYKAFDTPKNFLDASSTCVGVGGTLAMPKNDGINAFLLSLKNAVNPSAHFWFGLTDQHQEGTWDWVDGMPLGGYSPWSYLEPNNAGGNEDCAEFTPSAWNDNTCSKETRFICQKIPAGCPDGYVYHQFSQLCYKAFNEGKTYNDAVAACSADGGTLAMPRHPITNKFLIYLKNAVDNNGFFRFGLTQLQPEGAWVWDDNMALGPIQPWAPGEPNNAGNEDCAEYFQGSALATHQNKWNDGPCTSASRKFICQVRLTAHCCPKPPSGPVDSSDTAARLSPTIPPVACRPQAEED